MRLPNFFRISMISKIKPTILKMIKLKIWSAQIIKLKGNFNKCQWKND